MPQGFIVRPAVRSDHQLISNLINFEQHVHRHLDWHPALEWLGQQPYWLVEHQQKALAALAFPPDPPEIAWIRLFSSSFELSPQEAWNLLFENAILSLKNPDHTIIAAVALSDWFKAILANAGFEHHQDIIVLDWQVKPSYSFSPPAEIHIRKMLAEDLQTVQRVDNSSFDLLWQHSLDGLQQAYKNAYYATVAELDGQIVGYQLSTSAVFSAHLARLAVIPGLQRKRIGITLVQDLLAYCNQQAIIHVTVNTQHDNLASLALYQKIGFIRTGEFFPVFIFQPK